MRRGQKQDDGRIFCSYLEHSRSCCGREIDSLHQHGVIFQGVEIHQGRRCFRGAATSNHQHRVPLFLHVTVRKHGAIRRQRKTLFPPESTHLTRRRLINRRFRLPNPSVSDDFIGDTIKTCIVGTHGKKRNGTLY